MDKTISIHALREEGDLHAPFQKMVTQYFYPRPPRGGRPRWWPLPECRNYFYPRPPRGGRLLGLHLCFNGIRISIHALREEGDLVLGRDIGQNAQFLSTPSARRATAAGQAALQGSHISIHALREEGDKHTGTLQGTSPKFLSTPSARRATFKHFFQQ